MKMPVKINIDSQSVAVANRRMSAQGAMLTIVTLGNCVDSSMNAQCRHAHVASPSYERQNSNSHLVNERM